MTFFTLVLALGAVARLTRLVNFDVIAEPLRLGFVNIFAHKAKALDFIMCPWCVSVWVAFVVAPLAYFFGDTAWFVVPALVLTCSHVAAIFSDR